LALTERVLALREYNRPGQTAALRRRLRLAYYRGGGRLAAIAQGAG
jgi:hypothetical protein